MKTALIFGSSGLIGKNILDLILGSNTYKKIKLFVRINPELDDSVSYTHLTLPTNREV